MPVRVPEVPVQGKMQVAVAGLAYKHNTALLSGFDTEKAYAHDTATYMFLLLGIPPKLIFHIHHMVGSRGSYLTTRLFRGNFGNSVESGYYV